MKIEENVDTLITELTSFVKPFTEAQRVFNERTTAALEQQASVIKDIGINIQRLIYRIDRLESRLEKQ